jgi:hypothetical protein
MILWHLCRFADKVLLESGRRAEQNIAAIEAASSHGSRNLRASEQQAYRNLAEDGDTVITTGWAITIDMLAAGTCSTEGPQAYQISANGLGLCTFAAQFSPGNTLYESFSCQVVSSTTVLADIRCNI